MKQQFNKRGVSEIVSYVILIMIAISIATLVFAYLKPFAKVSTLECPSDIHVVATDFRCDAATPSSNYNLSITLANKGLFNTDAIYIRFGQADRQVLKLINDPNDANQVTSGIGLSDFYVKLRPGADPTNLQINLTQSVLGYSITPGEYKFEVQPAVWVNESDEMQLALCTESSFTQIVNC